MSALRSRGAGVEDRQTVTKQKMENISMNWLESETNPFCTATSTSMSRLNESEWHRVSAQWYRGIDWCVERLGRHWKALDPFGIPGLFKTKTAAYNRVTELVLMESKWRKSQEWERYHGYLT
jgi:hypothetical protein